MANVSSIRNTASDDAQPETMPHSIEAEQQLLGAILTNNDIFDRIASIIGPQHFYEPVHSRIFETAASRITKNALASPVTLKAFLEEDEGLQQLGGTAYLARLAGAAISAFAARDYAQMIYDMAIRRELILVGRDISDKAARMSVDSEPKEQIVEAEQALYKLAEQGSSESGFQSFLKAVTDAVNVANAAYQREGGLAGISTGLADMDKKLGGLHKSDLLILAGRPSMGKTSLATNIAFNIAKAVARFSFGLSKKDETSRLIERMCERINQTSSAGFFDDATEGFGGNYNLYGVMSFVFVRSALQLHANSGVRDRKLPTLRTYGEKYIKMMPDLVRHDGLGWAFGRAAGAYGQMHCISLILQGLRDGWIPDDQKTRYYDILRRLFMFFYETYLDQEHGFLDLRDEERTAYAQHTTRMANFDAARYLCQWSRLAKTVQIPPGNPKIEPPRTSGRFVIFDKSNRRPDNWMVVFSTRSLSDLKRSISDCG